MCLSRVFACFREALKKLCGRRFVYDGARTEDDDTPDSLGMGVEEVEDMDMMLERALIRF